MPCNSVPGHHIFKHLPTYEKLITYQNVAIHSDECVGFTARTGWWRRILLNDRVLPFFEEHQISE